MVGWLFSAGRNGSALPRNDAAAAGAQPRRGRLRLGGVAVVECVQRRGEPGHRRSPRQERAAPRRRRAQLQQRSQRRGRHALNCSEMSCDSDITNQPAALIASLCSAGQLVVEVQLLISLQIVSHAGQCWVLLFVSQHKTAAVQISPF